MEEDMPGDHRGDKYRVLGWLWLVFVVVVSCDRVGLRRKTCVCALTGRPSTRKEGYWTTVCVSW